MSVQPKEIEVFQSESFERLLKKLETFDLKIVENEIDKVINNPLIGDVKKGDITYLRIHKFKYNDINYFLAYSLISKNLTFHLLSVRFKENQILG